MPMLPGLAPTSKQNRRLSYETGILIAAISIVLPPFFVALLFVTSTAAREHWVVLLLTALLISLLLVELELLPEAQTGSALRGQASAFAVAAVLAWKWLLIAIFLLHMLNIYVYLGTHPIWPYLSGTARKLLYPFSFLRVGKVDLSPVIGAIAVYAFAELFLRPLVVDVFQRHIV